MDLGISLCNTDFDLISVVSRIMVSEGCPHLIPGTCECYITWQRRIKVADVIKVDNQLTLKWGEYPALYSWIEYGRRRQQSQCQNDTM